jgi:hypothetical protein
VMRTGGILTMPFQPSRAYEPDARPIDRTDAP